MLYALRYFFAAVFVLVAIRGAADDAVEKSLARYADIDQHLRRTSDNHLYTSGRLNGKRNSFLIDTGWSYTTVATKAVRGTNSSATQSTTIHTIELGSHTFTNQTVRVKDMRFNGQRAPFDAVLGLDFLRDRYAILDCTRRHLYLRDGPPNEIDQYKLVNSLRQAGYIPIQLHLKAPPALTVSARVNEQAVELLVDSGAAWSCVDKRQTERLGLRPLPSLVQITGTGSTGVRSVAVGKVNSIRLGEFKLGTQTFAIFDLTDWGFAAPDAVLSEVQGILGGELLAASGAIIDCHALTLWLKPTNRN